MTVEHSGQGDPARTVELLWGIRREGSRGPRAGLSVKEIVTAAVAVADEDGLDALSMRRVAERLGTGTMSLYRYVPGKSELLDLMVDHVSGEAVQDELPDGWRARLESVAWANRRLHERHPWLLRVVPLRPPLGPGILAKYDQELRAIDGTPLTEIEMDSVLSLVLGYVHEATSDIVESELATQRTGRTDDEWWQSAAPVFDTVFDPEQYPVAARIGLASTTFYQAPSAPEFAFEFGLARVLDGIEAFMARKGVGTGPGREAADIG